MCFWNTQKYIDFMEKVKQNQIENGMRKGTTKLKEDVEKW